MAKATVDYVSRFKAEEITFVITGGETNEEDLACAAYFEAVFKGEHPEAGRFIRRVYDSKDAIQHLDPHQPEFPLSDLDYCTQIDRFDFAMPITPEDGRLVMRMVKP